MNKSKQSSSRLKVLFAPLAVLLHLLIVDVAVEAVLSGVRGRWWVVGVAAGFLVVSGLMWPRSSWRSRTATATLVLLSLFGFAALLAEDLSDQLRVLGQEPPAATAILLALGIALAGLALTRVASLPLWARGAMGILATYGVLAFVVPVVTDAAYPSLLGGEALWPWQPKWLEGGFVGSFIVLPAGFLALLVAAVRGFRSMDRGRTAFELVALGLCGLLTVESFTSASSWSISETSAVLAESRPASDSETRAQAHPKERDPASRPVTSDDRRPVLGESATNRHPRVELPPEP
ncbi:MAG: hypothetical protein K8J08_04980, partial [Thermoanaerobaculia bacterium]|nr:hypothetical protein [Thermoanaerobaculia bacterium]